LGKVGHQELKRVALQICNQFLRHETACVLNHISTIISTINIDQPSISGVHFWFHFNIHHQYSPVTCQHQFLVQDFWMSALP